MCGWYHSSGRKRRGTKEPLDEGEGGEWKSWLKTKNLKLLKKTNIMASSPITSWQIEGKKVEVVTDFLFFDSTITVDGDCNQEIRRHLLLGRKAMTNLKSIEKHRHYSADKGPYSQGYGQVQLWELDRKEGGTLKNWSLQTMVLEKTPESSLDSKEIKPVNLKGDQPWLLQKSDAAAETPVLWSSDENSWLTGKDWGQKEKRES